MKELGAESAAIQLDAGAGSAQHVLLGRTQIALKPTAKGLGMPRIFVRAKRKHGVERRPEHSPTTNKKGRAAYVKLMTAALRTFRCTDRGFSFRNRRRSVRVMPRRRLEKVVNKVADDAANLRLKALPVGLGAFITGPGEGCDGQTEALAGSPRSANLPNLRHRDAVVSVGAG